MEPLQQLAVKGLTKRYPGVTALDAADFDLRRGEVHALVGENGAGKSTLIKLLAGDIEPDEGTITVAGSPVIIASPVAARRCGIVTIFQELTIVPWLSVAENVALGNEPTVGMGRQIYSHRQAIAQARKALDRLGAGAVIDPSEAAAFLSTAQQQIIEIARALLIDAPIIIMDEPTAALSANEADALLRIIRQLRDEGRSILFVSHRLNEVLTVADRITVLRGGRQIATLPAADVTGTDDLIEMMVGRPLNELFPPRNTAIGEVIFSARGLGRTGVFEDISFDVRRGEVLGLAGLMGAGRTETMRAIFGADPLDAGQLIKAGKIITVRQPRDAIASGIAYMPEDRKEQGLVLELSGEENVVMAVMDRFCRWQMVNWAKIRSTARDIASRLQFRGQIDAPAWTNSGGNQQKLIISKWVATGADLLIFDEPTRGIDIGAKVEVYRLIQSLAAEGAGVVLVSSELPELMNVAHRIIVMSAGRIQDELALEDFEERRILTAAFAAHISEPQSGPSQDVAACQ